MTLLADPAQLVVNWVGSAPCQLGDESPVNSETWNLNEGKRAARVKETDDVTELLGKDLLVAQVPLLENNVVIKYPGALLMEKWQGRMLPQTG